MLRECRRVLREGGRLASVAIEPAPGLDAASLGRARELGPSRLTTRGDLAHNSGEAGLTVAAVEDWTAELAELLRVVVEQLEAHEAPLRAGEGDDVYEHELEKKRRLLRGVQEGLLVRTLVVAER